MGHRLFPVVGWAERGDGRADGHGNSVPRFHITWGTGPGVVAPFERRVRAHAARGRIPFAFRHRVDGLRDDGGAVAGVRGTVLEPSSAERGRPSSRDGAGEFELRAQAVIVTSGGIGGNHDLVRQAWPERLGDAAEDDGLRRPRPRRRAHARHHRSGPARNVINPDRMWHYVEGLRNWDPIWDNHGIRILPGPSSLWLDATGKRLPAPYFPGFDTLGTLRHLRRPATTTRGSCSPRRSSRRSSRSRARSRTPTSPARTSSCVLSRVLPGAPAPGRGVQAARRGLRRRDTLAELVAGMNELADAEAPDLDAGRAARP